MTENQNAPGADQQDQAPPEKEPDSTAEKWYTWHGVPLVFEANLTMGQLRSVLTPAYNFSNLALHFHEMTQPGQKPLFRVNVPVWADNPDDARLWAKAYVSNALRAYNMTYVES